MIKLERQNKLIEMTILEEVSQYSKQRLEDLRTLKNNKSQMLIFNDRDSQLRGENDLQSSYLSNDLKLQNVVVVDDLTDYS